MEAQTHVETTCCRFTPVFNSPIAPLPCRTSSILSTSHTDVERGKGAATALRVLKLLLIAAIAVNVFPDIQRHAERFNPKRIVNTRLRLDPVERFERRLSSLRAAIPSDDPLGYLSDSITRQQLYQTQYSLAPNLLIPLMPIKKLRMGSVDPADSPRYVVGIFNDDDPAKLARLRDKFSLKAHRAFGEGVYLFEVRR